MRVKLRRTAFALATLACALPNAAHAFCRATTTESDGCECPTEGAPTYWQDEPIYYALNEDGFPGISEQALRKVLARSFAHWTDVSCGGEPIALSVEQLLETTPMTKKYTGGGPNLNVISYFSAEEFVDMGMDPHAFALTTTAVRDKGEVGEIVDADIVFNGGMGPFAICPESGCKPGESDIENVATHEMGHFLGLAHSSVEDSTMECSAKKGELKLRSLETDDEMGICAIYAPEVVEERSEALHPEGAHAGCGCRVDVQRSSTASTHGAWLALLALFFWRRRARGSYRARLSVANC